MIFNFLFLIKKMGIYDFYRAVMADMHNVNEAIPTTVSALWIDANSIFYKVHEETIKQIQSKSQEIYLEVFYKVLSNEFDYVLNKIRPLHTLGIMVDGIAPLAKVLNQRVRRHKHIEKEKGIFRKFNTKAFTPGTEIMFKIDGMIKKYIKSISLNYVFSSELNIIYSSHRVPGEGEHKIMDFIRQQPATTQEKQVIYGNDNDLIVASCMSDKKNLYVCKDIDRPLISIDNFKINLDLPDVKHKFDDLCVLLTLLGNDFLPRSPSMDDALAFADLLKIYKQIIIASEDRTKEYKGIVVKNINTTGNIEIRIHWDLLIEVLSEFIGRDGNNEFKYIFSRDPTIFNDRLRDLSYTENTYDVNIYKAIWYKRALAPRREHELVKMENFLNPQSLSNMTNNYLHGILWTLTYYNVGPNNINTDYCYHYDYTPLLSEIINSDINDNEYIVGSSPDNIEYTILENLLCVLPRAYSVLIQRPISNLMTNKNLMSPIADLYPLKWDIDTDGTPLLRRKEVQTYDRAVVLLPTLERLRVREGFIDAIIRKTAWSYKKTMRVIKLLTRKREDSYYRVKNGHARKYRGGEEGLILSDDNNMFLGNDLYLNDFASDFVRFYKSTQNTLAVYEPPAVVDEPLLYVPRTHKPRINKNTEYVPRLRYYLEDMYGSSKKRIVVNRVATEDNQNDEIEDLIRQRRRNKINWNIIK